MSAAKHTTYPPALETDGLDGRGWEKLCEWMAQARQRTPVLEREGVYHVFRAEDVRRVLSDTGGFSSDRSRLMPSTAQLGRGNLTMMDPPDHTRVRRIVNQAFTPATVQTLQPAVQEIADELVTSLDPASFDVVNDLAYPLPIRVICRLLGLPEEDIDRFRSWSVAFSLGDGEGMDAMHSYLADVARHKRVHPNDDLMTGLVGAEVDGEPARDDEVASLAGLILLAGHVTTTSLIAAATMEIIRRPALDNAVRHEGRVDDLVAETLRLRPAFAQVTRIAVRDAELSGNNIPEGALVQAWILSGNHDPALNPEPDAFVLDRPARRHLSFGHGVHYCLGGPLAQLEAAAALGAIQRRFRELRITEKVGFHPMPTLSVRRLIVAGKEHL